MEIRDLQEEIEELRPESASGNALEILVTKIGQMAKGDILLGHENAPGSEEEKDRVRRDAVAGVLFACIEYAADNDLDLDKAVEERLESIRSFEEQRQEVEQAVENKDAEALAEALGADTNEVPTGMFEDDDDEDDRRGVY